MEKIEALLDRLLREVVTLPEMRMQSRLFGARLKGLEPAEIVHLLDLLCRRGRHNPGVVRLKSMLVDTEAFKEVIGTERYRLVRLAAMESGCNRIVRLLVDIPPPEPEQGVMTRRKRRRWSSSVWAEGVRWQGPI